MFSYKIYRVMSWLPDKVISICEGWNSMWWSYCHYKWGKGPRLSYKTTLWEEVKSGMNRERD